MAGKVVCSERFARNPVSDVSVVVVMVVAVVIVVGEEIVVVVEVVVGKVFIIVVVTGVGDVIVVVDVLVVSVGVFGQKAASTAKPVHCPELNTVAVRVADGDAGTIYPDGTPLTQGVGPAVRERPPGPVKVTESSAASARTMMVPPKTGLN